jgi:hypothetical protein
VPHLPLAPPHPTGPCSRPVPPPSATTWSWRAGAPATCGYQQASAAAPATSNRSRRVSSPPHPANMPSSPWPSMATSSPGRHPQGPESRSSAVRGRPSAIGRTYLPFPLPVRRPERRLASALQIVRGTTPGLAGGEARQARLSPTEKMGAFTYYLLNRDVLAPWPVSWATWPPRRGRSGVGDPVRERRVVAGGQVAGGFTQGWVCSLWQVSDDRAHRWRASFGRARSWIHGASGSKRGWRCGLGGRGRASTTVSRG